MNRVSPQGSIIIVDLSVKEFMPNQLYIAKVHNENTATFKRYKASPPRLEPDSTEPHDTIFLGEVKAKPIGQVVRTMMDFD